MNYYVLFATSFDGHYLPVILHQNNFYVPLKSIIQRLGLNWKRQAKKEHNGSYGFRWCHITDVRLDFSTNDTLCIMLSDLGAYLKSIKQISVPVRMRDKLEKYQNNCARTLIHSINSPNLDGVDAIITSMDPTLFRDIAIRQGWNSEALKKLGVCVVE